MQDAMEGCAMRLSDAMQDAMEGCAMRLSDAMQDAMEWCAMRLSDADRCAIRIAPSYRPSPHRIAPHSVALPNSAHNSDGPSRP